jgi:hypothetical protein
MIMGNYSSPPGKRLHNDGKSPFFIGKSNINNHVQELCQSTRGYLQGGTT